LNFNIMNKKTLILSIIVIALFATVASWVYFVFSKKPVSQPVDNQKQVTQKELPPNGCLEENEIAGYNIKEKTGENGGILAIDVKNKLDKKSIQSFEIKNVRINYRPIETHKCGVYIVRQFNYNPNTPKQSIGYKEELWRYVYNGVGENILLLAEKQNEFISYFASDFRVSPSEKYIILEKGYLGKDDYALVIKDLKTMEDVFVLSAKSTFAQYPNMAGSFGFDKWTDDSRYFWGDIFDGAYVNGYFRIDTQNWKADIFESPDGAMGGSPLNINTGYLPIQPGQVWTGDYEITQELKEQHKREGKKSFLYLYNLFTKEKKLIETTNEPIFWFKPEWLSDTELQYELPSGEKKIYKINE